jgi:hypothetical protein
MGFLSDSNPLAIAGIAVLAVTLVGLGLWYFRTDPSVRLLLGSLVAKDSNASFFVRGLFVPNNELFSRAPEDPRNPASGLTVHKWAKIPELYSVPDVRAIGEMLQLVLATSSRTTFSILSGETGRQTWGEDSIAIGPHYKALQILDACEPKLVTVRQPAAFRTVQSSELFEAKEGHDFGLVYKGFHPATHRSCWVVMGLSDAGTAAAAHFFHAHIKPLARLIGGGAFAAIISVDTAKGWEGTILKSLQPKPTWWRRLLYQKSLKHLMTTPWLKA